MSRQNKKTVATHMQRDDCHAVAAHALRVMITRDGSGWFAQGLEIDYAAGGNSIEDVKGRFQRGLEATIHEHLKVFGSIEHLMKLAPSEEWQSYTKNKDNFRLDLVTFTREQEDDTGYWPFANIAYIQQQEGNATTG